jgi:hypothetical protein
MAPGEAAARDAYLAALRRYEAERAKRHDLPAEVQRELGAAAERALAAAVIMLGAAHEALGSLERDNERVLNSRWADALALLWTLARGSGRGPC